MKKLITILLLLLAVSVSYGQLTFTHLTMDGKKEYKPSEVVSVGNSVEIRFSDRKLSVIRTDAEPRQGIDKNGNVFTMFICYMESIKQYVTVVLYEYTDDIMYIIFEDKSFMILTKNI